MAQEPGERVQWQLRTGVGCAGVVSIPSTEGRQACRIGAAYDMGNNRVSYPKFHRWEAGFAEGIDFCSGHFIVGANLAIGLTPATDEIFLPP